VHSAAAIVNGQGLVFVGHSEAGKSTTMELLKAAGEQGRGGAREQGSRGLQVEILCDDRNVIRKWNSVAIRNSQFAIPDSHSAIQNHKSEIINLKSEWRVHGTWSHGTTADVSSASAPLRAILFLQQDTCNEIAPLTDRKEIWRRLLATLIRPMVTAEWWQKELDVLQEIVDEIPCYTMRFDRSGAIVAQLVALTIGG
jgi:hypothetical protein